MDALLQLLDSTAVAAVAAVPLIVAIVEAIKRTIPGFNADRWGALTAVAVGVALSLAYEVPSLDAPFPTWRDAVVAGVVLGLAASGLYSGYKAARGS